MTNGRHDTEYRVGADVSPAKRHVTQLVSHVQRGAAVMGQAFGPAAGGAGKLTSALGPAGAAGAAGALTAALIVLPGVMRDVIAEASNIGKVADRIDVTTDFLQEFRHVAKLSGVDVGEADKALEQFNKRIGEAVNKGGPLKDILEANGVALKDSSGNIRSTNNLLTDLSRLISGTESAQVKATIANEAFGRSGLKMINVLQQGPEAFEANIKTAQDLGVAIGEDLVREAEILDDKWENFTTRLGTLFKTATLEVASSVNQQIQEMDKLAAATVDFFNSPSLRNSLKFMIGEGGANLFTDQTINERIGGAHDQSSGIANQALQRQLLAAAARARGEGTILPDREDEEAEVEAKKKATKAARELASARKETAATAKHEADRIKGVVEALAFEAGQIGLSSEARRINNELRAAGVDINSEAGMQIATLVTQIEREEAAVRATTVALELLQEQEQAAAEASVHLFEEGFSAFKSVISGAQSAEDAVKGLALGIAEAAAQAALFGNGPLAGLFGQSGGLVSNLPGVGSGASPALPAGGWSPMMGFAKGGVTDRPAIFGEGPLNEAAVPLPDGRRIPVDLRGPAMDGRSQQATAVHVTADVRVMSDDEKFTAHVVGISSEVIKAASSGIVGQSVAAAQSSFGKGGFNTVAAEQFRLTPQATVR